MRYQHEIKRLHHSAYRCRDSEETRQFYEGILGLRLATGFALEATKTERPIQAFHSFYELDDGSFLAFFEVVDEADDFVFDEKSDFDLHIALSVTDKRTLLAFKARGEAHGVTVRGPVDHGICESVYFRDPNGYVIELASSPQNYSLLMEDANRVAHAQLADWQERKHQQGQAS